MHTAFKNSFFLSNHLKLYIIILLEGFVTISLEILTIRQLIPVAGNSVIVTSLIIGIFLLFLAYGYKKGGDYTNNYTAVLIRNFSFAAIMLGVGLSYLFIGIFFSYLEKYLNSYILIPLIIYLLIITAPIVYCLGQTVPITFNLFKHTEHVGRLSGQILHLSTIGSFAGAILTTLILLNFIGVAWTIFINYWLLVTLVVLLMEDYLNLRRLLGLCVAGIFIYLVNIQTEKTLFVLTNSYANYHIKNLTSPLTKMPAKILQSNDSDSSYLNAEKRGFPYIEAIKKILFNDLKLHNKQILVLGAGGFTLSAAGAQANYFTYVDIDPAIATVVKRHFIPIINGKFIIDDARHYLTSTPQHFDVVISDTYSNRMTIPAHLLTYEYLKSIWQVLNDDGIAIFNIIARPMLNDAYSKHIDNTIRAVFANCMVMPATYSEQLTNIIYSCRKTNYEQDEIIYTDNLNPVTLDFFNIHNRITHD